MTSSQVKLLYLEDEVIIALDTEDMLRSMGVAEISVAHRLETAEKLAQRGEFTHALLDINVGRGCTSFELGRKLAEQGVHVIFASGYDRSNFSGQVEGFDYIEKPLDPSSLKRCCPILEDQLSA